jgi:hypothetical protein
LQDESDREAGREIGRSIVAGSLRLPRNDLGRTLTSGSQTGGKSRLIANMLRPIAMTMLPTVTSPRSTLLSERRIGTAISVGYAELQPDNTLDQIT